MTTLNVEEIMRKIKEEVAQRKNSVTAKSASDSHIYPELQTNALFEIKGVYEFNDFTKYHDSTFIKNAYLGILGREPDSHGTTYFLAELRKGNLTKADILCDIRFSKEGKQRNVTILGIKKRYIFSRLIRFPILGNYLFRPTITLLTLPWLFKKLNRLEADVNIRILESIDLQNNSITELKNIIESKADRVDLEAKADKSELQDIFRQIKDHKLNILDNQRRLRLLLEEARKRLPEPISVEQIETMVQEDDHLLDAMYVAFEDRFRGTREDIKKRQRIYLPYMTEVIKNTGGASVLDVGCGRGEWLELLKENKIEATGIDLNRIMVHECTERGLNVKEAEVIDYLRKLESNSLAAVTGFHIVEHLPLKTMISLFDESLRVLKSGGIVIFETPNPENLIVGACNFYTDPSHINPIPPHTLEFLLEARGFVDIKVMRLNENKAIFFDDKFINHQFAVGQDFCVIGKKV